MSPMSRPPAAKKQRGGATPRPASSGGPPVGISSTSSRPGRLSTAADDAIARRRAELRRLQAKRTQATAARVTTANRGPSPPTASSSATTASISEHLGMPPPVQTKSAASSSSGGPPTTTTTNTSTPAVNRKLQFPSSNKPSEGRSHAKSAPPSHPPPSLPPSKTTLAPPTHPTPMTPSALLGSSLDHETAPMPFSRTAERAQARKEREALHPEHAHSPHLVPSTKTMPIGTLNASIASKTAPPMTINTTNISSGAPAQASQSRPKTATSSSSSKHYKINMMRNSVANSEAEEVVTLPTPAGRQAQSPETDNKDTTSNPLVSVSQLRLEQAYNKAEEEKTAALVKIKQLEDQLLQAQDQVAKAQSEASKLPPPGSNPTLDYTYMLQLAETDGPKVALAWAKTQQQQQQSGSTNVSSTPMGKQLLSAMSPLRNVVVGRMDTPKHRFKSLTERSMSVTPVLHNIPHKNMPMKQIEFEMRSHFQEAAQYVPYEFSSSLATYIVRRPYGNVTAPELFQYVSPRSDADYASQAHVSTLSALEVGVTIHADNSALLLFHKAGVRYKTSTTSDWKVVDNVEELDKPLGYVTYIDEQAKELEYSLDDIVEEALMVREQYSSSMINMALGLKNQPLQPAAATAEGSMPALAKAPSKDVAVETEEKGTMTAPATTATVAKDKSAKDKVGSAARNAPSAAEDQNNTAGSSDMLTMFMGMILSSIIGLIYFVVIGLPLRIVQTVCLLTMAYVIFNMIYFYLAIDYNNWLIGESDGMAVSSNDLVSYYSNIRYGIM
jgi:hypothetical protein